MADWNIRRAKNALDRATAAVSAAAADNAGMATMLESNHGGVGALLEVTLHLSRFFLYVLSYVNLCLRTYLLVDPEARGGSCQDA